jgi:hypothetical protein
MHGAKIKFLIACFAIWGGFDHPFSGENSIFGTTTITTTTTTTNWSWLQAFARRKWDIRWISRSRVRASWIYVNNCPTRCSYIQFISVNSPLCFGWYFNPSSGAHVTVSTVSTRSRPVTFTTVCVTVLQMPDGVDTMTWAPDYRWRYHPKHVEQFTDTNKLYIVASRWIIIDRHIRCSGILISVDSQLVT